MSSKLGPYTKALTQMLLPKAKSFRSSNLIQDPLSLCFSEKFLVLEKPNKKSKKPFWKNVDKNDVLVISVMLKETGNRGITRQFSCTIVNETKNDTYTDYPVNILRHIKSIKYKQLDK